MILINEEPRAVNLVCLLELTNINTGFPSLNFLIEL